MAQIYLRHPRHWHTEDCFDDLYIPEPNTGCWLWIGPMTGNYGQFTCGTFKGLAHRFSFKRFRGPIIPSWEIDHSCKITCCVNPLHLEQMTGTKNKQKQCAERVYLKNTKTHCPQGHEFTPENTYIGKYGYWSCKTCKRLQDQQRRTNGSSGQ